MTIPSITPFTNIPSITDPTNFALDGEDFLSTQLPARVTEMNAAGVAIDAVAASITAMMTGGGFCISYTFAASTSGNPGTGAGALNNATQASATTLRLNLTDAAGATQTSSLDALDDSTSTIKGRFRLTKVSTGAWLDGDLTAVTTQTGYRDLTISNVSVSAANPFTAGDALLFAFTPKGDKGDTGAAPWGAAAAWLTATAYTATAPASVVTNAGSAYVCLVAHTSGTFATDLAAGKWLLIAQGATGTAGAQSTWIPISQFKGKTSGAPAAGVVDGTYFSVPTLDFDSTADEFAGFYWRFPKRWDGGTVTISLMWAHPATTVNFGVTWLVGASSNGDNEALGGTSPGSAFLIDTGGTTDRLYITAKSSALTVGGSPAAEDLGLFYVKREPGDASDTLAVDAKLVGATIYWTSNAENDA